MKVKAKASPAPSARPVVNPHCEPQWPYNIGAHHLVACLLEASTGAGELFRLIHADLNLAEDRHTEENPEALPAPLTPAAAFGLRMALKVCLDEIQNISERLECMAITPAKVQSART